MFELGKLTALLQARRHQCCLVGRDTLGV